MTYEVDTSNPDKPKAPKKDPQAILDYTWDWSAWLTGLSDTISAYNVTVPSGMTRVSQSEAAGKVTAKLSGGTAGQTYGVTCQITTAGGRVDERTLYIPVKER